MTSHKRLKLRQCTNCECVINGVWEWVEECARGAAAEEPAMRGILDDVCLSRNSWPLPSRRGWPQALPPGHAAGAD
ncbi:MAG: hypothetical protein ACLRPT_08825 [Akkermansia muciniphila]